MSIIDHFKGDVRFYAAGLLYFNNTYLQFSGGDSSVVDATSF
jgi:hypothetical protein